MSTDYWVVVGSTGGGNPFFNQVDGPASDGPFAFNGLKTFSGNAGATWRPTQANSNPLRLEMNAVPEPSSIVIFSIGVGLMGYRRRRQHSRF